MGCNTSQELKTTNEGVDVANIATENAANAADAVINGEIEGAATKENGDLTVETALNHSKTNGDASNKKLNGISTTNSMTASAASTASAYDANGKKIKQQQQEESTLEQSALNGAHNAINETTMQHFNQDINNVSISDGQKFTYTGDNDDDEDEEKAATKIQAVFRGHQVRSTMKKSENNSSTTANNGKNAATENGASASDPQPTKAELEAEFDPNDKELCEAASKIQATFRGHLQRKMVNKDSPDDEDIQEITKKVAEELDIDLTDPELNKAATKIQASFRGHKTRKDAQ